MMYNKRNMLESIPGLIETSKISKVANSFIGLGRRIFERSEINKDIQRNTSWPVSYDLFGPIPHDPRQGSDPRSIVDIFNEARAAELTRRELLK